MNAILLILNLAATTSALASPAPMFKPADREAAILAELQRTLEVVVAHETQTSTVDAPILDRATRQASDDPAAHDD